METKAFSKSVKIFLAVVSIAVIIGITASAIISVFYEKAIIRYMKNYLDSHLLTQLSMDDIRFRVLKGFPNATIEINNVVLLSGDNYTASDLHASFADTLLQADHVFLQFNLFKMLQKQYELKKIEITDGTLNILFDQKNRDNLTIWKSDTAKGGAAYVVNLKSISVADTRIRVISARQKFNLYGWSYKTHFKGDIRGSVLTGLARGDLMIHDLTVKDNMFIKKAPAQVDLDFTYSNNHFRVSKGRVKLNKAEAAIKGEYAGGKNSSIDLTATMAKFGLEEMFSLLPFAGRFNTGTYAFSGNGKLNIQIKGSFQDMNHFTVKSDFKLTDCTARNTDTKGTLNHVTLQGTVSGTNKRNFRLDIDTLSAMLGKGQIRANFKLRDLDRMLFESSVNANLDLKSLKNFALLDTFQKLDGNCHADFFASGNMKPAPGDTSVKVVNFLKYGNFRLEEVAVQLKHTPVEFSNISGKAVWNEHLHFDTLKLTLNETNLLISGDVYNLSAYLINTGSLKADLSIKTDILNINKYLNQPGNNKSGTGYKSLSVIPANVNLKADIRAGEFIAGKFKSSGLRVKMSAQKDSVYLNDFSLKFPAGSINGYAFIIIDNKHNFSITCNAQPRNIDIKELFYAFNNFTQHFIVEKNIRGYLGGTISFFAQWDSALNFNPASMKAKGEFQINDGELVQFEPMLKLSKYIDVEELKHIRFKTLKNTIFISDRIVNIPEMAINSSAFNLRVSGQHSFDNQFDYRMKVLLSEVLFNKARKKKKEIDEYLLEETPADQTTIPIIVAGTPSDFDVRFDRKKAFNLTRNKMKNGTSDSPAVQNSQVKIEWEAPVEKKNETQKPAGDSDFEVEWDE